MTGPAPSVARFEALYRANARALLTFALRRAARPEDAADVLADTMLVAWRRIDDVPHGDEARLWPYGGDVSFGERVEGGLLFVWEFGGEMPDTVTFRDAAGNEVATRRVVVF